MTIAIGILGKDHAVIAADTEMTWGEGKSEGCKVFWEKELGGGIVVTGAGLADYIENIAEELCGVFSKNSTASLDEIERLLKLELRKFHRHHVIPFASYEELRPDIWLIIAARRNGSQRMWKTEKTALTSVRNFAAVGAGRREAEVLFDQASLELVKERHSSELFAAYLLYRVKALVSGCGKNTDLVYLAEDGPTPINREAVARLDYVFERFLSLNARLLSYLFFVEGRHFTPVEMHKEIDDLRSDVLFQYEESMDRLDPLLRERLRKFMEDPHNAMRIAMRSNRLSTKDDPKSPQPSPELPGGMSES